MKKAARHFSVILKGILITGFSIQIAFGAVWMCFHFGCMQEFGGSEGILYRGLRALTGGQYWILYLLQLSVGFYAGYDFFRTFCPEGHFWNSWRSLVLLSFPMAMQCHMALSPCSLVSSCFLLELSGVLAIVRGDAVTKRTSHTKGKAAHRIFTEGTGFLRNLVRGGLCWLALSLLLPEYFILGGIPLVLAVLFRLPVLRKRLPELGAAVLVLSVCGGVILGIGGLSGEKGYVPDRESVCFALFSRMAWPTLWPDSEHWPMEVQEAAAGCVWESSQQADNMQIILRPRLREKFGDRQAAQYYLQMAAYSWKRRTPLIIRQIGGDFLGYCMTPLILPMQLEGEAYASYSGRNYEMMFQDTPLLTKYYVRYGCKWFAVMLVLASMLAALNRICRRERRKSCNENRKRFAQVLICLVPAGIVTAVYTFCGAGVMDYKRTVAVVLLWLAAALLGMRGAESENQGSAGAESMP